MRAVHPSFPATSRACRFTGAALLLLTAAGCGTVTEFRYQSAADVSPRMTGTPRVTIRPLPDLFQAVFPGHPDFHQLRITETMTRAVEADFGANVFTGAGPDVRVVVEIRRLTLSCSTTGTGTRADADISVELKAADLMVGRFNATGADSGGDCGSSTTEVPVPGVRAFQNALERIKSQIGEARDKLAARMSALPGFGYGGGSVISRPTGGARLNVAVADLEAQEVSGSTAAVISDWLRGALVAAGTFNVVERGAMQKVLAEQAFQQSGCTNQDCAVKLGRVLNVNRMVVGSIGKLLASYVVNVRVVDVETGQVIASDSARGKNEDEIEHAVREMAGRLAR